MGFFSDCFNWELLPACAVIAAPARRAKMNEPTVFLSVSERRKQRPPGEQATSAMLSACNGDQYWKFTAA
jgi:hypothetical protein